MSEVVFTSIPVDELATKIANLLKSETIANTTAIPIAPAGDEDRLLTRKEAAEYLHVTFKTLSVWTATGRVKASRIGCRVYYSLSDIKAALTTVNAPAA